MRMPNPATDALAMQWVDIDMYSGPPLPAHPRGAGVDVPGSQVAPTPIIRVYGVTDNGNSVLFKVEVRSAVLSLARFAQCTHSTSPLSSAKRAGGGA